MDYSEKIKNLRKQKGLSQGEIADFIGISQAAYGKIETGFTKSITIEIGKRIAMALGISFHELFDISPDKNFDGYITALKAHEHALKDYENTIKELLKRIEEKDLVIDLLKNEKIRLREDIFRYLEEIYELQISFLDDMKNEIGLNDFEIKTIKRNAINLVHRISTSFFMGKGLIKESDYDKLTSKYTSFIKPADVDNKGE